MMILHLAQECRCHFKNQECGAPAADQLQPAFVLREFGSITCFLETNNLTKWFHSSACCTRTVVPRWLWPSKSFTDVSEVAQCCPKKSVSDTSQEAKSVQPMFNALGVCWFLACTLWKVHSIKWVWKAQLLKKCSSLLRCWTMQTTSLDFKNREKCCPAEPTGSKREPETIHLTLV